MLMGTDVGGIFRDIVFPSRGQKTIEFLKLPGNRCLGVQIMLRLTQKVGLWRFPVEAICNSERGLARVYQGSSA